MSIRRLAVSVLLVVACGTPPEPRAPAPSAPAPSAPPPNATEPPASEPAPPPEPAPAPASTQLAPPQTWELHGTRPDGQKIKMGEIVWRGGEDVTVAMRGTMKLIMQQQIGLAIEDQPADPAAAIQGVVDLANESGRPMFEWVRAGAH